MKKIIHSCFILLAFFLSRTSSAQNTFTYKVGEIEISLLSEGQQTGKTAILLDVSPEILKKYTPDRTFPNATNAFLVRTPNQLILIDAGLGTKLFDNLQALGVTPEQINIVFITHMHGDHIGGLLCNGEKAFPNAEIYVAKQEYKYWDSNKEMKRVPENRRKSFEQARKVFSVYKKKLHKFNPAKLNGKPATLIPGIDAIAAYGHTPGHTMYMLSSGSEKLLVWGDLTHAMAVQMPHPEIAVTYDVNPQQAIVSRQEILKYVVANAIPVAGMHIAFPGMGKVYNSLDGAYLFRSAIDHEAVKKAIKKQLQTYPESRLQDIYKNFFQDYFGPGHLISDTLAAGNYLRKELNSYTEISGPLAEPTGWQGCFYRVNLSALKENKISYPVFFEAFLESARQFDIPSSKEWLEEWKEIVSIIDEMQLNLPNYDEDKIELLELILSGNYAVHHSQAYNSHYQPHYRLISKDIYEKLLNNGKLTINNGE